MVFKSLFLSLINNVSIRYDLQKDPTLSVSFILWNINVPICLLWCQCCIYSVIIVCCVFVLCVLLSCVVTYMYIIIMFYLVKQRIQMVALFCCNSNDVSCSSQVHRGYNNNNMRTASKVCTIIIAIILLSMNMGV